MEGTKNCPFCAEEIQVEALICRHCRFDLRTGEPVQETPPTPPVPPKAQSAPETHPRTKKKPLRWVGGFFLLMLAIGTCISLAEFPDVEGSAECVDHIEAYSVAHWARELGRPESWVASNFEINLFERTTAEGKGRKVGGMPPGAQAEVLDHRGRSYRVRYRGSTGWISDIQVARVVCR